MWSAPDGPNDPNPQNMSVTLYGKRDFANMNKLQILRWGSYSGLPRWDRCVDEECHLPYRKTKDVVAINASATAATPAAVHPEGIQDGEKLDAGPR